MPSKKAEKEAANSRRLRFDGDHDSVDMRPVVGFKPGTDEYDSEEAQKFVFYPPRSKTNPLAGARQFRDGVAMTEEQALEILTSPYRVWGFSDITHLFDEDGAPLTVETAGGPVVMEGNLERAPMQPLNAEEARVFQAQAAAQTPASGGEQPDGAKTPQS